jgi:hypothetical protein
MEPWIASFPGAVLFQETSLLGCLVGSPCSSRSDPPGKVAQGGCFLSGVLRCPVIKRASFIASPYVGPGPALRRRGTKPRCAQADYLGRNRPRRAAWRWVKRDLGLRFNPVAAKLWGTGTRNAPEPAYPMLAQGIIAPA